MNQTGFTLVEIMITVMVIALLAALAIPAFMQAREVTRKNLCLENQHVIYGAASMHEMEQEPLPQDLSGAGLRSRLMGGGYIDRLRNFECPSSNIEDFDDYALDHSGENLIGIICTYLGIEHSIPN